PINLTRPSPTMQTTRPIVRPTITNKSSDKQQSASAISLEPKAATPPLVIDTSKSKVHLKPSEPTNLTVSTTEETKEKPAEKLEKPEASKKKFPYEEN